MMGKARGEEEEKEYYQFALSNIFWRSINPVFRVLPFICVRKNSVEMAYNVPVALLFGRLLISPQFSSVVGFMKEVSFYDAS